MAGYHLSKGTLKLYHDSGIHEGIWNETSKISATFFKISVKKAKQGPARRLKRETLEEPFQIGNRGIQITIGQGVTQATQEDDFNSLFKKADDA